MYSFNAEKRNTDLKPKQLRRTGVIPGVLYGKSLEASISIQFTEKETNHFLRFNAAGSKVELNIEGKKYTTLLREVSRTPASDQLEHLSFQMLALDEIVTSSARIILLNREMVQGLVQNPQSEVTFKALPKYLVDKIELDLEGKTIGDSVRVSDLEIANNPEIEVVTPADTLVYSIVEARIRVDEAEEDAADAAEDTAEETTEA